MFKQQFFVCALFSIVAANSSSFCNPYSKQSALDLEQAVFLKGVAGDFYKELCSLEGFGKISTKEFFSLLRMIVSLSTEKDSTVYQGLMVEISKKLGEKRAALIILLKQPSLKSDILIKKS